MMIYKDGNVQVKALRKDYNTYDIVVFIRKIFGKGFQEAETLYRNYTKKQVEKLKQEVESQKQAIENEIQG